jgi:hypothetical protein
MIDKVGAKSLQNDLSAFWIGVPIQEGLKKTRQHPLLSISYALPDSIKGITIGICGMNFEIG